MRLERPNAASMALWHVPGGHQPMNQQIGKAASCYITPTIFKGTTEMVNTTIITKQINTLIRQYTLTFLITFPLTSLRRQSMM
jgi:hypothetical protein